MRVAYNELANYNNGRLVFEWFDLEGKTKEEHYQELQAWLDSLPPVYGQKCEEWCVGDVEDIPRQYVSDYGIDDEFFTMLEAAESSNLDIEVFIAASDLDIQPDIVEELYQGEYSNDEEFAQEMAEQLGYLNEELTWPHNCIDWERAARDLMFDYGESDGHYFRTCY